MPPWAVSFPAQLAAIEALKDPKYYRTKYKQTNRLKKGFVSLLSQIPKLKVYDSVANFILVELTDSKLSAAQIINQLKSKGIFLRNCDSMSQQFDDNFIRIAVRNKEQNKKIAASLRTVIQV